MKKSSRWPLLVTCLLLSPLSSMAQGYLSEESEQSGTANSIPELDCVIEPSEIVDAGSAIPGLIESIYADRSDLVRKGDVIARLESSVEQAAVERAKAQAMISTSIELRQQSVNLASITKKRNTKLLNISAISAHDMDQLETENRIAGLQVKQEIHNKHLAELEYQRAQAALDRMTIRSPVEGVVMDRYKAVGEYVEDEPVMRVAKLDPLFIEVVVPVDYLGLIQAGMKAQVLPAAAGQAEHTATVERVDRVADAASGTYGVRLSVPNPDYAIAAGVRCKLAFIPESDNKDTLNTALIKEGDTSRQNQQRWVRSEQDIAVLEETSVAVAELSTVKEANSAVIEPEIALAEVSVPTEVTVEETTVEAPEVSATSAIQASPVLIEESSIIEDTKTLQACYSIGPLVSEPLAEQLSEQLGSQTSTLSIHKESVEVSKAYYVLAEAVPTLTATRDLTFRIRKAGIVDSAIVRSGVNNGRISLGVYGKRESALRRQQAMADKGFTTEVVPLLGEQEQYWLDVALINQQDTQGQVQQITTQLAPLVSLKPLACNPQVANR